MSLPLVVLEEESTQILERKKEATMAAIFDFQSIWKQYNISMYTSRYICTSFQGDWTTLQNRQLWRHGGQSWIFFENESSITSLRAYIHFCMYIIIYFSPDPTVFYIVRVSARNAFYVWRHSRHFENLRTWNLKRGYLTETEPYGENPMYIPLVIWRSSRHKKNKMAAVAAILDDLVKN